MNFLNEEKNYVSIEQDIKIISNNVDENILSLNLDIKKGTVYQNILSQLRNFVEHVALLIYAKEGEINEEVNPYDNIKKSIEYIKSRGSYKFISEFHQYLQISASHYTSDEDKSERLMLKYLDLMLQCKKFLNENYKFEVFENIEYLFPIFPKEFTGFYSEINKISKCAPSTSSLHPERFYIQKIKPIYIDGEVLYEVTFYLATENSSKSERLLAYTKHNIMQNYAIKIRLREEVIEVFETKLAIQIIENWEASIRPCEFQNLNSIFGNDHRVYSTNVEYERLMKILTSKKMTLNNLIDLSDKYYEQNKIYILEGVGKAQIMPTIDKVRRMVNAKSSGANILRYLISNMNNKIIKKQLSGQRCGMLSNLYLSYSCIPFDNMPLATSLVGHNPNILNLMESVDIENREHELLARKIKNNTEINGQIYTSLSEIEGFAEIDTLVERFNSKVYHKHTGRYLKKYSKHVYSKGYMEDAKSIIEDLIKYSNISVEHYESSVKSWLEETSYNIDDSDKEKILKDLFTETRVALIYGAAGTGKSTLINHVSNFFNHKNKVFLANTNPATDNLKRKVNANNCEFSTIAKYLNTEVNPIDILFIDECSTVSNSDMKKILNRNNFTLLVLVGDIFQIESILFGNWFYIAKELISEKSIFELSTPYRTKDKNLITLWESTRKVESKLTELLSRGRYSHNLDKTIFESYDDDEIILCLNYDGFYGINNINKYLQSSNPGREVQIGIKTYKVGDPILFNDSNRFAPAIYNNLKGEILEIEDHDDGIVTFTIEIDKVLNELDSRGHDFEVLEPLRENYSVIRFQVLKLVNTDYDDNEPISIVPFQVAYAISIHKAQGLDFTSVKVVINDEVGEQITHNIFYTAITRARKHLKIYWSADIEKKVISNLNKENNQKDFYLFKNQNFS